MIQKIDLLNLDAIEDIYIRENFRRLRQLFEDIQTGGGTVGQFDLNSDIINNITNQVINSAGLWTKFTTQVAGGATGLLEAIPLNDFRLVKYIVVMYNTTEGVSKGLEMSVASVLGVDGNPKNTVRAKVGSALSYALNATTNGSNMDVELSNNETYELNITVAKLLL